MYQTVLTWAGGQAVKSHRIPVRLFIANSEVAIAVIFNAAFWMVVIINIAAWEIQINISHSQEV